MLRRRKEALVEVIQATKNLDAFPKLEDDYKELSSTRGTISLLVYGVILTLVCLNIRDYFSDSVKYSYDVDFDYDSKLKLNVDITVAMPCQSIGADVMDKSSKNTISNQNINMEDTWFELSPNQHKNHEFIANIYDNIRKDYHSLHSSLWHSFHKLPNSLGPREVYPHHGPDACRIHGTYDLNKIAGNFHIIIGKSVSFMGNHAHMVNFLAQTKANFSHRIDNFSFGDNSNLVHNALNFDIKVTESDKTSFQYFVSVVSTEINSNQAYQYSVTEKHREIDHGKDSHGTAGILFKYDISPLKVKVNYDGMGFLELLISLIGIIGGIFATSTMLNSIFQSFKDFLSK
ncbi:unnamed protein product [Brachionus calyciflorus]|uniref:Endoplasmic reticulum-Golgi intermediate compartment protein 2 n=1 Tax=Brachionus calyciflorus TaxID=104777 RepID=A0A814AMA5_9BILA|nr:unnamed protein product [Brachionus calyciflorus]